MKPRKILLMSAGFSLTLLIIYAFDFPLWKCAVLGLCMGSLTRIIEERLDR